MSERIEVTVTPASIQMSPGEANEVDITVKNNSTLVDFFPIELLGLDPSWYRLDIAGGAVMPHGEIKGILTIRPPKDSTSLANTYPLTVKVVSRNNASEETSVPVTLEVLPFYSFEMDLRPQRATGARGFYNFNLTNTGNTDLNLELQGRDPEDLCRFLFDPHDRPRVAPGELVEGALLVHPRRRPLLGRPKMYSFELTATPDPGTAEPMTKNGALDATSRIGVFRVPRPSSLNSTVRHRLTGRARSRAPAEQASRWPSWAKWALLALAVVVLVVILVWVLIAVTGDGCGDFEGSFLLDPGKEVSYGFQLQEATAARITATAQWQGTAGAMELVLQYPDGTRSSALTVTPADPDVTFIIDEASARQGASGWVITVVNASASGQGDGSVKLKSCKLG